MAISIHHQVPGCETPTCLSLAISTLDGPMNAKNARTRGPRELLFRQTKWLLNIFEDIRFEGLEALLWDSPLGALLTGRGFVPCIRDPHKARCFFRFVDSSLRRASFPPYSSSLCSTDRTAERLSDGWTLESVYDLCVRYDILFSWPHTLLNLGLKCGHRPFLRWLCQRCHRESYVTAASSSLSLN